MCWVLSDVSPKYFFRTLNQAYSPDNHFGIVKKKRRGERGREKNQLEKISPSELD